MGYLKEKLEAEATKNGTESSEGLKMEDNAMVDVTDEQISEVAGSELADKVTGIVNSESATKVDKHDKFREVGKNRVNQAIRVIKRIGYLSNKKNYQYSDEEVTKMIEALEEAVAHVKKSFQGKEVEEEFDFD